MARLVFIGALAVAGCGLQSHRRGVPDDDGSCEQLLPGCQDFDGDGHGVGEGCCGDCDDSDPRVWAEDDCEADCDADPHDTGCPCDAREFPEPEICYGGPEGTLALGICRAGIRSCSDGAWTPCNGQQLPGAEVCDDLDNDCDGEVDEGVTNECGTCDADCDESCVGVDCGEPFDPDAEGASGVELTPEGGLTLGGERVIANHVIWIANSTEGTVSKINTRTREEEGRYRTGPGGAAYLSPSRTTVNYHGDVVVVNRGTNGEATRYDASDCPDANHNGRTETSSGRGDVLDWMEDECWIWSTPTFSGARGSGFEYRMGLDGVQEEYVWVGSTSSGTVYEIDATDGEKTGREVSGTFPYGLAVGPESKVWTFNAGGGSGIVEWTTTDDDLEKTFHAYMGGCGQYGITVDSRGRVWVGGSGTCRYDPDEDAWERAVGVTEFTGGIAVDADDNAWTGEDGIHWGAEPGPWFIDGESLEVTEILDPVGGHGWAVDVDGYVWCIPFVGNEAFVIDPDTLEEDDVVDGLVGAYTYSDMTGLQLINATNPVGVFPHVFEAGCEGAMWLELDWDAIVPAGTSVAFRVKTANDAVALAAAPFVAVATQPPDASPADIGSVLDAAGITSGRLLEVEATLRSVDREAAPILNRFSVTHACPL